MLVIGPQLHRRFRLGTGDRLELSTPSGEARIPIVAVIVDFSSDKGTVIMDRSTFLELYRDDRVDTYDLSLEHGADPGQVRAAVRKKLGGRMPALVSTRKEFLGEIGKAIDSFYVLTRVSLVLALGVAFLGIVTSLLISVVERTREFGVMQTIGGTPRTVRRMVVSEGVFIGALSWVFAIVLALPLSAMVNGMVGRPLFNAPLPLVSTPLTMLIWLAVVLIGSALASAVPAWRASRLTVRETLAYV